MRGAVSVARSSPEAPTTILHEPRTPGSLASNRTRVGFRRIVSLLPGQHNLLIVKRVNGGYRRLD
jgi:hypothetical protein